MRISFIYTEAVLVPIGHKDFLSLETFSKRINSQKKPFVFCLRAFRHCWPHSTEKKPTRSLNPSKIEPIRGSWEMFQKHELSFKSFDFFHCSHVF